MTPAEIAKCREEWQNLREGTAFEHQYMPQLLAAAERLAEIEASVKADADDLEKMRDGTKLTRAGLVSMIVYLQQDLKEAQADAAAWRAVAERLAQASESLLSLLAKSVEDFVKHRQTPDAYTAKHDQTRAASRDLREGIAEYRRLAGKERT